eukprot:XP_011683472.1 PREDICTED: TBC1 domain family member 31 [Strongylocentrotus purpuratus]
MQYLELDKRESGKIWHRKPSPSSDNGLMVQISKASSAALKFQGHTIRFLQAGFDASGDRFIAGDHQGHIYVFDLHRNRFQLVQKLGIPCTAIAFTLRRKTEYLVALSDCSLKCYDTDSKEMVAWMKGHETPVHSLSVHASGRYALTTSNDTALLWDLDTFTRKRKLNVKDDVNIVKVFFLPLSNTIMTCFRDDTMFAWESDTLQCKYQLPIPPGDRPHYKAFATPRDGRLLVTGGKCQFLHIWALDTRSLLRVIEMPSKVRAVKQIHFLPESFDGGASQMVGVLSQDGLVRIIHIHSCKLLCDLGSLDDRVVHFTVSPSGRNIVAIMESGRMNIYSIPALLADFNKPPPPLVKATSDHSRSSVTSRRQRSTLRSMAPGVLGSQSVIGSEVDKKQGGRSKTGSSRTGKTMDGTSRVGMDEDDIEISALPDGLSMSRLAAILKGYGEYPAKYRMFIWRSMLRLPENHVAFSTLVDKGSHLAWAKVHENYPIKSRKLLRVLQRKPACLLLKSCNHPAETGVQGIGLNDPSPIHPSNILGIGGECLAYHDRRLLGALGLPMMSLSQYRNKNLYAWPIMPDTLLRGSDDRRNGLKLFDHVFTNHPSFSSYCGPLAYLTGSRGRLVGMYTIRMTQGNGL